MKTPLVKTLTLTILLSGAMLVTADSAWARGRDDGHHRSRDKGRHEVVVSGPHRYHYRDGHFTRPGLFGFTFRINVPPVGVVVSSIPAARKTVIVGRTTYYYYDRVYYRPCPTGFVVVPAPTADARVVYVPSAGPDAIEKDAGITVHVPHADGSFTPVTLTPMNGGYVGPQGEYYAGHPTVDQLKVLYGK